MLIYYRYFFIFFICIFFPFSSHAEKIHFDEKQPLYFKANEIHFDNKKQILRASGSVEIYQNQSVLKADNLIYIKEQNTIELNGNITFFTPDGEIAFSEKIILKNNAHTGLIEGFRLLLKDQSQFSAKGAIYEKDQYWILSQGRFSPCHFCKHDPKRPLLWQLKADRIMYDKNNENIYYEDVVGEVFGLPIFYLPYFSHPSPAVKRRSGFLTPSFGNSDALGTYIKTPFYGALNNSQDLTVTPWLMTRHKLLLEAEYRQKFKTGKLILQGSGVYANIIEGDNVLVKDKKFRGHLDAKGDFYIQPYFKTGFNIALQSDDTYRRLFKFKNEAIFENRGYIESLKNKNYFSAEILQYEDLRNVQFRKDETIIFPLIQGQYVHDTPVVGGIVKGAAEFRAIEKRDQTEQVRLALEAEWTRPFINQWGVLLTSTLSIESEIYSFDNNELGKKDTKISIFPIANFDIKYPLTKNWHDYDIIIEPTVGVILAPKFDNKFEVPSEDTFFHEVDDSNIFNISRLTGKDRRELGSRIYYGLTSDFLYKDTLNTEFFIGQSYQFYNDTILSDQEPKNPHFSDFVGRLYIEHEYIDLFYRFLLDKNTLSFNKHEASSRIGTDDYYLKGLYSNVRSNNNNSLTENIESLDLSAHISLTDYWSVNAGIVRNFTESFTPSYYTQLTYEDECLKMGFKWEKISANDRDFEEDKRFIFEISLKHLGDYVSDNNTSN